MDAQRPRSADASGAQSPDSSATGTYVMLWPRAACARTSGGIIALKSVAQRPKSGVARMDARKTCVQGSAWKVWFSRVSIFVSRVAGW